MDNGVGVDFAGGGSGGVTEVDTSTIVFVVEGTGGNELLVSSFSTTEDTVTGIGDREDAAIFFSISRTCCATLVRSRRRESSYCKIMYNKGYVRIT